jgi:hypothetical protein
MLSLVVSHRIRKVFTRFYLIHAFQNAVIVLKTAFGDFAFLNRFTMAQPDRYRVYSRGICKRLNNHGIRQSRW